jgi:hypothetical protein
LSVILGRTIDSAPSDVTRRSPVRSVIAGQEFDLLRTAKGPSEFRTRWAIEGRRLRFLGWRIDTIEDELCDSFPRLEFERNLTQIQQLEGKATTIERMHLDRRRGDES